VALIQQLGKQSAVPNGASLTGREAAVLALMAAGHSTRTIARLLDCSPRTVDKHLERIFRKLGVRDRLNAVLVARAWGLAEGARPADVKVPASGGISGSR
jgi:DNA-binding CsgD family transcriptional regulator